MLRTLYKARQSLQCSGGMGLESGNHWINLAEINSFDGPGHDLKLIAPSKAYVFGSDLPPAGPSFIARVCGFDFDSHGFRIGQARRARSL